MFAEVIEYTENVRDNYENIRCYYSHNLPIPDCFNSLTQQALADEKVSYIWYIEEDTVPPNKALDELLAVDADIAAIDYGFNSGWNTIVRSAVNNEILFTGFGCTLIKRRVFEKMEYPYFNANKAFNLSNKSWYDVDPYKVYGMYDINFGYKARELGFTFAQAEGECRHLQLLELGQKEINKGCHLIGEKDRISRKITI